MNRRRTIAIGVGAVFIWWGLQAAFLIDSFGALWFGTFVGGFVAALGAARSGYDGVVEAVIALGVVLAVAAPRLAAVGPSANYGPRPRHVRRRRRRPRLFRRRHPPP
ncbi:hypothetical protein GJ629_15060, partial [Halapricum sp. CBA1109]|uniref:hypothetical protein n=1 Tax=Halapricum sp. CBA1109 TaxID=2668068 RepID=UPI0012FA02FA